MTWIVIVIGVVISMLLMVIIGHLSDIKSYAQRIYFRELNMDCDDPSDHYKFDIKHKSSRTKAEK